MSKVPVSLVLVLSILAFSVIAYIAIDKPTVVMYDCRIAEISPDVPVKVKEECRKNR
jgi:hypothetical protein